MPCAPSAKRPKNRPRVTFARAHFSIAGGKSSNSSGAPVPSASPTATATQPMTPWRGSVISSTETAINSHRLYSRSNITTAAPTRSGTLSLRRHRYARTKSPLAAGVRALEVWPTSWMGIM